MTKQLSMLQISGWHFRGWGTQLSQNYLVLYWLLQ